VTLYDIGNDCMYMANSPYSTEPCQLPAWSQSIDLCLTTCLRSVRYDCIHNSAVPDTPNSVCSRCLVSAVTNCVDSMVADRSRMSTVISRRLLCRRCPIRRRAQWWPWVGLTHGLGWILGWVVSRIFYLEWVSFGWVEFGQI